MGKTVTQKKTVDTFTVLVVEDNVHVQKIYAELLEGDVQLLRAYTVDEAEKLFDENPYIAAVVMDGHVPSGTTATTLELVRYMRARFKGPIIANSDDKDYQEELRKAGCDHWGAKAVLPVTLRRILGI